MHIILSRTSGVPMYEQIVEQIRSAIYSGGLAPGDPLPSLRQLARDLEVSLITTTRAYNDLAAQGLIANQQGRGSFVLPQDPGATRARLNELLDRQTNELLATARLAGLNRESLLDRIDQQWKRTP
ncbi:GntR family transcriptional regulator [Actinomyces polynesiensis]|uniref:GntR family transcriptional regulator n=1 Tax=Actinomyces polynesiensis TaxID=1325934 RepID=UPI000AAE3969|nr:GntR family transcriptional regulator [Actinomyces polynesiensis]